MALALVAAGDPIAPIEAANIDESRFVPISPCRLTDTRQASRIGPLDRWGTAETNTVQAIGTNGECTIPADAIGLSLNVTALGASAQSFLTFWPDGDRPLAASLNPSPGQPPIPNAVTTQLGSDGAFRVYNDAGSTHVVIDVNGYYSRTGIDEVESQLAAITARLDALETQVDAVDAREAFVVSTVQPTASASLAGLDTVLTVNLTAPDDGRVLVSSTLLVVDFGALNLNSCSLTTGTTMDSNYDQAMEAGDGSARASQVAGFRVYDVNRGDELTVNLVCQNTGPGAATISDGVMTATFLPG